MKAKYYNPFILSTKHSSASGWLAKTFGAKHFVVKMKLALNSLLSNVLTC